ncbi:MAG: acetate--CoA ligase family protein [Planctomycetota bacterium]
MGKELDCIFRPKSIAVIGASKNKGKIGREIIHNLIEGEFEGKVFPINPKADVIHSIKCYNSVLKVPDDVDLAVIVVPRDAVKSVVEECIKKGVKGIILITAGYRETGEEGKKLEEELTESVRKAGIRLVGPNCMGIINADLDTKMNTTFASAKPLSGKTLFLSQSGALGQAIIDYSSEIGIGFSKFVSLGNRVDVSVNDIVSYCSDDPNVELILLYLESFGNPRNFIKIARKLSKKKPIIAVKSGRTAAGAKAAVSHTGSLAGLDVAVDALFEQCGVLRAATIEELFEMAKGFVDQPRPKGNKIAILTNAGGPAILATDAFASRGLELAQFSEDTKEKLKKIVSAQASVANPVDMTGSSTAEQYTQCMDIIIADKNIDSLLVVFVPPIFLHTFEVAKAIVEGKNRNRDIPVFACFMTGTYDEDGGTEILRKNKIPNYVYPESAAIALGGLEKHRKWTQRSTGTVDKFEANKGTAAEIIKNCTNNGRKLLTILESQQIFEAYGINVVPSKKVETREDALSFADVHGFPLVLKIISTTITHKSDRGGVILNIGDESELLQGLKLLNSRFKPEEISAILVQKMIKGGKETIIGMTQDPTFGPLIMFGLGGIYVEVLKDVSFRIHPLTDIDIAEMIKSIRGYPLLTGTRGEEAVDIDQLKSAIMRISQLVGDFHEIESLEINPFLVSPPGKNASFAVDARIILS